MDKPKIGYFLLGILTVLALLIVLMQGSIPQDPMYHLFADSRTFLGIPNTLDVVSNILFLLVGGLALFKLKCKGVLKVLDSNKLAYIALFFGAVLVTIGSGYYHLWPDNQTLVWDRLAMTIAFMGLFSVIVSEFVSEKIGKIILLPMIALGLSSVIYWIVTETSGVGDLRFYVLVQFLPISMMPIILIFFKSRFTQIGAYWWLFLSYVIAKLTEHYDGEIFDTLGVVSGHSLKHFVAALGLYILLRSYERRECV